MVAGSGKTLTFAATEPQTAIAAAELAGLSGTVSISVVQVGDFAESRPVSVSIETGAS
jgi:hypothetical protein